MASYLTGLRWSDWRRLLREHAPAVDRGYRLRAAGVSVGTVLTSLLARWEPEVEWSDELEELWRQPVIILGLPRSGTTFLHQLLACNPRPSTRPAWTAFIRGFARPCIAWGWRGCWEGSPGGTGEWTGCRLAGTHRKRMSLRWPC